VEIAVSRILSARNITKRYGGITAVSGASLDVNAAEVVSIIGPNGAGKSTLLKIVCGLLAPDVGEVNFNNKRLSWRLPFKHYRSPYNFGVVLQRTRVLSGLTPAENIRIGLDPGRGRSFFKSLLPVRFQARSDKEVELLLREFLGDNFPDDAAELSGGQKRILELLRLKVSQPLIVALDEPTAGLHQSAIDILANIIRDFTQQGIGVLLSEHNLDFVNEVSNRVLEMNRGDIVLERSKNSKGRGVKINSLAPLKPKIRLTTENRTEDLILRLRNLEGGYDRTPVFHSLSFDVYKSRLISFVGPNGTGKSTALKAIANLLPWRRGEILWGAQGELGHKSMLGQPEGMAFVLQSHRIFDKLTVEENLLLAADRLSSSFARLEAINRARTQLPQISESWWSKTGWQLSGGEQQLLAIAQGLVSTPKLLLLDEPTAGLNRKAIQQLQATLQRLLNNGTSIIMAEHNLDFVSALSDQVVMFRPGGNPLSPTNT
jgi:branched-chain amino acid transport system ATP-binding protein